MDDYNFVESVYTTLPKNDVEREMFLGRVKLRNDPIYPDSVYLVWGKNNPEKCYGSPDKYGGYLKNDEFLEFCDKLGELKIPEGLELDFEDVEGVQDKIESMLNETPSKVMIFHGGNCLLALHKDFREKFFENDRIKIAGENLNSNWGCSKYGVGYSLNRANFSTEGYYHSKEEPIKWAFYTFDKENLKNVILEIEIAKKFDRLIHMFCISL